MARFGGYIQAKLIVALGELPARLVDILQEVIADKTRLSLVASAKSGSGRASRRGALAATQGEELPLSVRHQISAAKAARNKARLAEKHLNKLLRQKCKSTRVQREVRAQREHVEDAWAAAEALSQATGHAYKNRWGQMVNLRPDTSIVNLTLRRYEQETGSGSPAAGDANRQPQDSGQ